MRAVALAYVLALVFLVALFPPSGQAQANPEAEPAPADDALVAPPPSPALLAGVEDMRGPSQFMAGEVAVLMVLPESNGTVDYSKEDWTPAQIAAVTAEVRSALTWWEQRLPLARLRFHLRVEVVPTDYEPTSHPLAEEGLWIGDTLRRLGFSGTSHFDQAYAAADALRDELGADWGTVLFVPNSANGSGHLSDGRFAYAYINGPFLVVTSDAGAYGLDAMDAVVAHELGHTFGALDQYAAARVGCDRRSGYLHTPTTNSQYGSCGTRLPSIMLDARGAFAAAQVDPSALHQLGYRDSDDDGLIDPLDTAPVVTLEDNTLAAGTARPVIRGLARDLPFPSSYQNDVTLNTLAHVDYRVNGGPWIPTVPTDGAFDSAEEAFSAELPVYDGHHSVEIRALNSAGGATEIAAAPIEVTWVGPAPSYSVSAPVVTAHPEVRLALVGPATTAAVQVSEDAGFANARWVPFGENLAYVLSAGDGTRTVFVRFRDQFDLTSPPLPATIVLDTQPPQGTARRPPVAPTRLLLQANDELSAVTEVEVQIGAEAPRWLPYTSSTELSQATADQQVTVRFRDAAGNISAPVHASIGYKAFLPLVRQ